MGLAVRYDDIEVRIAGVEAALALYACKPTVVSSARWQALQVLQEAILRRLQHCEAELSASGPAPSANAPAAPSVSVSSDSQANSQAEAPGQGAQDRLSLELSGKGISEFLFQRAPPEYYDEPLEYRREVLGAQSISQLCKSLVLENTKARNAAADAGHASRYFCVVIQYAARLHAEKVRTFLHKQSNGAIGRKQFNMRLANESESEQLTGYGHNSVTPVGMSTGLPILLSHHIAELPQGFFWMGGGETDLKLGMKVCDFIAAYQPSIVDCTHDN